MEDAASSLARLTTLSEAVDTLVAPDERRKSFLAHARFADRLYAAVKPHPVAAEFAVRMSTITAITERIRLTMTPEQADVSSVLARVGEVLDRSIEGHAIAREPPPPLDLSKFDFQALAARFRASPTPSLDLERLKAAIRAQLDRLIAESETRVDFREKFEALISAYNEGSAQVAQLFAELLKLAQALGAEQTRHVREHLTEDELVLFDLLTRPGPDLTTAERDEVKKVARDLLGRLRTILMLDWQKTALARARVRDAIEETLEAGLPSAYTDVVFKVKAGALFDHVYRRYGNAA